MLLNEMEIFYYVVEQKSFSKAAEKLNVSKSYISKSITKLEKALQLKLLIRTTRELILTEGGQHFYLNCAKVVSYGAKGYAMADELRGEASGILKVSIPPALALNLLNPMLAKYMIKCPNVILDIRLESRLVDLIAEGYDIALRSANLQSSSLIAQRIFEIENILCATPAYLNSRDAIKIPEDLKKHSFALYNQPNQLTTFDLTDSKQTKSIGVTGRFYCNQLELVKQIVLADQGIGMFPKFMVLSEIDSKRLTQILVDYKLPRNNLYAIYPEREFMLPKINEFLKILKSNFEIQSV